MAAQLRQWLAGTALAAAAPALWAAPAEAAPAPAASLSLPLTFSKIRPADSGRLKFRANGPACVCAEGLSEADIAQRAKRPASAASGATEARP
jgi:hypothetical protein